MSPAVATTALTTTPSTAATVAAALAAQTITATIASTMVVTIAIAATVAAALAATLATVVAVAAGFTSVAAVSTSTHWRRPNSRRDERLAVLPVVDCAGNRAVRRSRESRQ